jgi:hypothetical protein
VKLANITLHKQFYEQPTEQKRGGSLGFATLASFFPPHFFPFSHLLAGQPAPGQMDSPSAISMANFLKKHEKWLSGRGILVDVNSPMDKYFVLKCPL